MTKLTVTTDYNFAVLDNIIGTDVGRKYISYRSYVYRASR